MCLQVIFLRQTASVVAPAIKTQVVILKGSGGLQSKAYKSLRGERPYINEQVLSVMPVIGHEGVVQN